MKAKNFGVKKYVRSLWLRLLYQANEKSSVCKQILTCTVKNQYLTSKKETCN